MPLDLSGGQVMQWVFAATPYIFIFLLVVYLVLGGILDFHWRKYGTGLIQTFKFRIAYVALGIIFLGIMAFSL